MADQGQTLSSWKEIAVYLNRTVRTCQRLEMTLGLPIHRLDGSPKARVFAYPEELDAWLAERTDEHGPARKRRRALPLAAGLVVVTTVALILLAVRRKEPAEARLAPGVKTIVVLPFDDLSPVKDHGYLAFQIPDTISNSLGRIRGFRLTSRMSAAAVKDRNFTVREIGRMLAVEYVVEGSYQVVGERLILRPRLIDARKDLQVWDESFDEAQAGGLLDIQDRVAGSIAENVGIKLLAEDRAALGKKPTLDQGAFDLYLQGRALLGQNSLEAPGKAKALFFQALERDPRFALAHAGVAQADIRMQMMFLMPPQEAFREAEAAVGRALALDPELAEGRALEAWVKFQYKWEWDEALKSFERALDLQPSDAFTRGMYAMCLLSRRQTDKARAEIKLALAMDPFQPLLHAYSMWIEMSSGHPAEVLRDFDTLQQLGIEDEFVFSGTGLAYLLMGRPDEAEAVFLKAQGLPWKSGRAKAGLIVCRLRKGDRKSAEDLYGELCSDRGASPIMLVFAAGALGKTDEALAWLDKALAERDPHLPLINVYVAAFLPDLARDPRVIAVLDRLRLPH